MPEQDFYLESSDLLHVAAWAWLLYLASLVCIDAFMFGDSLRSVPWIYYAVNGAVALIFLGAAYWKRLPAVLKSAYLPLMLVLISALPIVAGQWILPFLNGIPLFNIEGVTIRLLPILLIGLVLTAWQYPWPYVLGFVIGTAALQFFLMLVYPPDEASALHAAQFITLLRAASFLVVGYFISRLMGKLRAQQAALAQTNRQLTNYADTLERLAVSQERNRLARELHDTLAHTLSGLTVQLETMKACWTVKPETAYQLLGQSLVTSRQGLDETRRALKALRAGPLEDLGLLLALRELCESAAERGRLKLALQLPDQIPGLPANVEQCLYRVAQEALENVLLHANATHLAVSLAVDDTGVVLRIQDDGLGFDVERAGKAGRLGLPGMRERAQLAGGDLTIDSQPGRGTLVQLQVRR